MVIHRRFRQIDFGGGMIPFHSLLFWCLLMPVAGSATAITTVGAMAARARVSPRRRDLPRWLDAAERRADPARRREVADARDALVGPLTRLRTAVRVVAGADGAAGGASATGEVSDVVGAAETYAEIDASAVELAARVNALFRVAAGRPVQRPGTDLQASAGQVSRARPYQSEPSRTPGSAKK